jgi:aspartyl-tRNA(Asn)/glutamyl-tRNA(Gln) amidotransferase subunit B
LSDYDAALLTAHRAVADYYEAAVSAAADSVAPKVVANWITGELFRLLKETGQPIQAAHVSPQALAELIHLVQTDVITLGSGKTVLAEMFTTGGSARQIVAARGLAQISDTNALEQVVARIIEENPEEVRQYLAGKEQLSSWLMGQVMRATRGQANPQVVQALLRVQLDAHRQ